MRLTTIALLGLLTAGCGGDDDDLPPFQSQSQARTAAERAAADSTTAIDAAGEGPTRNGVTADPDEAPSDDARSADRDTDEPAGPSGDERLYTVQIAAFTDPAAAEELEEQLRGDGMPVWTSVAEQGGQTFYRLRVGVVPTVADARRLGTILTERYDWPVWVAALTPADRLPANAVEGTRRVLGGG